MNHDDLPVNEPSGACNGLEEMPFQPTSGINNHDDACKNSQKRKTPPPVPPRETPIPPQRPLDAQRTPPPLPPRPKPTPPPGPSCTQSTPPPPALNAQSTSVPPSQHVPSTPTPSKAAPRLFKVRTPTTPKPDAQSASSLSQPHNQSTAASPQPHAQSSSASTQPHAESTVPLPPHGQSIPAPPTPHNHSTPTSTLQYAQSTQATPPSDAKWTPQTPPPRHAQVTPSPPPPQLQPTLASPQTHGQSTPAPPQPHAQPTQHPAEPQAQSTTISPPPQLQSTPEEDPEKTKEKLQNTRPSVVFRERPRGVHREQSNNQGHRGIDNEGSRGWDVGCENGVGRGNPPKLKARGRGRGRGREKRLAQKSSSVTESEDQAIKQSRFQQNQLLVRGLSALTTKDCLVNFIEAMSGGEVEHVMRRDDKALITMTNDITDFSKVKTKCEDRGLESAKVTIEQVPVSRSIVVSGISDNTSHDAIELYFENQRYGGGPVERVEFIPKGGRAVVVFKDPKDLKGVLARQQEKPHVLNQAQLSIRIFHELLENQDGDLLDDTDGQETNAGGGDKAHASQQSEMKGQKLYMAVDPDVMALVTTTAFRDELSNSLATRKSEITWKPNNKMAEIVYKGGDDGDSWQSKCISEVQNYLGKFQKRDVQVNKEFWSAVVAQLSSIRACLREDPPLVKPINDSSIIRIVSLSTDVKDNEEKLKSKLEEIYQEETRKSYAKKALNVSKERLILLKKIKFLEKLQKTNKELEIKLDTEGEEIYFEGPESQFTEATTKFVKQMSDMIEKNLTLSFITLKILGSDEGLKKVQSEMERNDVEAVFVIDKDSGARIVSTSAAHWDTAEKLVNSLILQKKVEVDDKSESLLKTPEWRELCHKINAETAVRIHSNNWNATYVTGFQDDVIEVMKKLNTFLESNSIREEQFTCSSRIVRRYLAEFRQEDLRCIEIQLKEYEVKIEKGKGDDDFDISGNRKSLTDVRGILDTLQIDTESKTFDVKQPGLRSYFDNGQGDRLVKLVEKDQNCAIQVERIFAQSLNENDADGNGDGDGDGGCGGRAATAAVADDDDDERDHDGSGDGDGEGDGDGDSLGVVDVDDDGGAATATAADDDNDNNNEYDNDEDNDDENESIDDDDDDDDDELDDDGSGGSSDSEDDDDEDEHAVSSTDPFSLVMTKGHHKISWRIGKIETEKADVLVSAVGATSQAIITAGVSQITTPNVGDITVSPGVPLANHVINTYCFQWNGGKGEATLRALVQKCLQKADELGVRSIAFPVIGTGNLNFPRDAASRIMLEEAISFCQVSPASKVRDIRFVVFEQDQALTAAFKQEMDKLKPGRKFRSPANTVSRLYKSIRSKFQGTTSERSVSIASNLDSLSSDADTGQLRKRERRQKHCASEEHYVRIFVLGRKNGGVEKAIESLKKGFSEACTTEKVENEVVSQLSRKQIVGLRRKAEDHDVKLVVEADVDRIVVRGQPTGVSGMVGEIWKEINERTKKNKEEEQAQLVSSNIEWKYKIRSKKMVFPPRAKAKIEIAYSNCAPTVKVYLREEQFILDLKAKTGHGLRTGDQITLTRKVKGAEEGIPLPKQWAKMPRADMTVHTVELKKRSFEYKDVMRKFQATADGANIQKIERIQNPHLYQGYTVRKQKMDKDIGGNSERWLFHGTDAKNVRNINTQGFNRSFCGENGIRYGQGAYFARDASYSLNYAKAGDTGHRYMYLARVLVGQYCVGNSTMKVPPPKHPSTPEILYESVVDNQVDPAIFVVFYDNQCYPEYLITMQPPW